MKTFLLVIICAFTASLSLCSAASAQQVIPLTQVILPPDCTIDIIDDGTGPKQIENCPDLEPTLPVNPDPNNNPNWPFAPNAGYYAAQNMTILLLLVGVTALCLIIPAKRRREDEKE